MRANANRLEDYLRGMRRHSPLALKRLQEINNWPEVMRAEIDRRAIHAIGYFTDDLILAIANGEVDIKESIRDILAVKLPVDFEADDASTATQAGVVATGQ